MSSKQQQVTEIRFWTPLRVVITLLVMAMLVTFGVSSCNSNEGTDTSKSTTRPATNPNALPPNVRDAQFRSLNGNPIRLGDYSGKVLLVNLWATWCGPCRMEIPELVRLHHEFQSQGFEVIGLSTENPDASAQSVKDFVRAFNMNYAVGWITNDAASTLMRGNGNIPQSFLITRDGVIIKRFVGFSMETTPPQLRRAVEEALKT